MSKPLDAWQLLLLSVLFSLSLGFSLLMLALKKGWEICSDPDNHGNRRCIVIEARQKR